MVNYTGNLSDTPICLLVGSSYYNYDTSDKLIEILVKHGADLTIKSGLFNQENIISLAIRKVEKIEKIRKIKLLISLSKNNLDINEALSIALAQEKFDIDTANLLLDAFISRYKEKPSLALTGF